MYQWLNEDFYDTLYHASEFVDNTKLWNATQTNSVTTKLPETNMVIANIGLLNSYEYYNNYRCVNSATCSGLSYDAGYLSSNGYVWWILNPYSSSNVWFASSYNSNYNPASMRGVRPSIVIKSGLDFTGSGTLSNPYKIVGDKDTGKTDDLINTRLSGEYIKLKNGNDEPLFRIIGVENNKTKIISLDYADNKATRQFSTNINDTLWGSGRTTDTDTWYTYLNNTYFPNLVGTYGNLFDSSLYYLGMSGYNYKSSVCASPISGNTKDCNKTTRMGTFDIGLPRYGEMFATTQKFEPSNSPAMWLMNSSSTVNIWIVGSSGIGNISLYASNYYPSDTYGARPTLHLKSTVKILSGSGTESDPYVVGL